MSGCTCRKREIARFSGEALLMGSKAIFSNALSSICTLGTHHALSFPHTAHPKKKVYARLRPTRYPIIVPIVKARTIY